MVEPLEDALSEVIVDGSDDEIIDDFEAYVKRNKDELDHDVLVVGKS